MSYPVFGRIKTLGCIGQAPSLTARASNWKTLGIAAGSAQRKSARCSPRCSTGLRIMRFHTAPVR